ncbi:hypothetical protein Ancab_007258 [Ancistrocladus abbreviatus]
MDAVATVKRYNNVELDGKPMKIEIAVTNIAAAVALQCVVNRTFRNFPGASSFPELIELQLQDWNGWKNDNSSCF